MDFQPYIRRIEALVTQAGLPPLSQAQSQVLADMWANWQSERPIAVEQDPRTGKHAVTFTEDKVYKRKPTAYSSYSITEYPPEYSVHVKRYGWVGNELSCIGRQIDYKPQAQDDQAPMADATKKADSINLEEIAKASVAGLVDAMAPYIQALRGTDFTAAITAIVADGESARIEPYFTTLFDDLFPGAGALAAKVKPKDTTKLFTWLYADGDADKQLPRRQAAQSYPWLMRILSQDYNEYEASDMAKKGFDLAAFEKLTHIIDERKPLAPALADASNIAPHTLRNLQKLNRSPGDYFAFLKALRDLDKVDSQFQPKNDAQMESFLKCLPRIHIAANLLGRDSESIFREIAGDWIGWAERTQSEEAIRDIKDWLKEVRNNVVIPWMWRRDKQSVKPFSERGGLMGIFGLRNKNAETVLKAWEQETEKTLGDALRNASVETLLACSQRWHDDVNDYQMRREVIGVALGNQIQTWAPLSKPVQAPNGIWLHSRHTLPDLQEEGRVLAHCVGGGTYAPLCYAGKSHIIGLARDAEGMKRLTTVQLNETWSNGNVTGLRVQQHQGYHRREPTQAEKEAVSWYCKAVMANPALTPDWKAIESKRAENRKRKEDKKIEGHIGFDPMNENHARNAWEVVRPYMPKNWQDCDFDKLMRKLSGRPAAAPNTGTSVLACAA